MGSIPVRKNAPAFTGAGMNYARHCYELIVLGRGKVIIAPQMKSPTCAGDFISKNSNLYG